MYFLVFNLACHPCTHASWPSGHPLKVLWPCGVGGRQDMRVGSLPASWCEGLSCRLSHTQLCVPGAGGDGCARPHGLREEQSRPCLQEGDRSGRGPGQPRQLAPFLQVRAAGVWRLRITSTVRQRACWGPACAAAPTEQLTRASWSGLLRHLCRELWSLLGRASN